MTTRGRPVLLAAVGVVAAGCGKGSGPGPEKELPEPLFPSNYLGSYTEVRDCRPSGDHDLNTIRILVDPTGLQAYQQRDVPFPEGATVLKEEYDFGDPNCEGPIKQWTVMVRLAEGSDEAMLDWTWQRVDAERKVVGENTPRCAGCHSGCTDTGYQGTCAEP